MVLVDTSAWIEFFRGHRRRGDEVDRLLDTGEASVCGPVLMELRRGFRTVAERRLVLGLIGACPVLAPPGDIWSEAGDLGYFLRRKGVTVKSFDLLIAAHALAHEVPLLTADADFARMKKAGLPLQLVD